MDELEETPVEMKNCPHCGRALPRGDLGKLCPACLLHQGAAETGTGPAPASFHPPTVEELSRWFPQLEVLAFLGKGGMGAVYKARQPTIDRLVALKILPPEVASGCGFAERFTREARALARLNHPNIVVLYEFGQAGGMPFFIMEYVDGLNLRQLEKAGRLEPDEALKIVPQICEALEFAHEEGIVHRDIKPENILLDKRGRVKIADFGIAKIMGSEGCEESLTGFNQTVGTPHYMAPEQVNSPQSVDHRADVYSLGVVFYEMLTGRLPLGEFGPPSTNQRLQLDVRLDEVVLRALESNPERRYQHVSQLKTAVTTITGTPAGPPPDAAGGPSTQPLEKSSGRTRILAFSLVGILVLLMALDWCIPRSGKQAGRGRKAANVASDPDAILVVGQVLDARTLHPLPGVRVVAFGADPAAPLPELRTDPTGRYELRMTNGAFQQILVSLPGYESDERECRSAEADPHGSVRLDFLLQPDRETGLNGSSVSRSPREIQAELEEGKWSRTSSEERLRAASRIYVQTQKDHALARIARDAAEVGDADFARKALLEITSAHERDVVAFASARTLAWSGQRGKGTELDLLIEDASQRDHALVELVSTAAEKGDANSAETALSYMTDSNTQVAAARDAIQRLADLGLRDSALKLAGDMHDASAQGQVFSALAR